MFPELGKDMSFEVYPLIQNKDNFTLTLQSIKDREKNQHKKRTDNPTEKGEEDSNTHVTKKVCNGHLKRRSISLIT